MVCSGVKFIEDIGTLIVIHRSCSSSDCNLSFIFLRTKVTMIPVKINCLGKGSKNQLEKLEAAKAA